MSLPVDIQSPKKISKSWWLLPILFTWLGGMINYFYWRNKNSNFAKRSLVIGIILMFVYLLVLLPVVNYNSDSSLSDEYNEIIRIALLPAVNYNSNSSNYNDTKIVVENNYVKFEDVKNTVKLSSTQKEIISTEENLKVNRDNQKDVWSLLTSSFFSDVVKSKDQVLTERIERLESLIPREYEELQYLHMDLKDAKTSSGEKYLQSRIKYWENMIKNMKMELEDLKNKGIVALEEYKLQKLKEKEKKYVEKIHRLEALQTKKLDYLNTPEELIQHISSYRGLDGKGNTLLIELKDYVEEEYYEEVIEKWYGWVEKYGLEEWDVLGHTSSDLFGTEYVGGFDDVLERYGFVRYGFFPNIPGYWTTIFEFSFDKETYNIVGIGDEAILVLKRLN